MGVIAISSDLRQGNTCITTTKQEMGLEMLKSNLNTSFEQIKEQFDDHLTAINENTNEIASNHEYLAELDQKIEKLSEKIDEINLFLKQQFNKDTDDKSFEIRPLTTKEKEIFKALYMLTEQKRYSTYKEVSRRTGYSETLVASYMTSLIEKGIPIIKKYANRTAYLALDSEFREVQARQNIVGIDAPLTAWVR